MAEFVPSKDSEKDSRVILLSSYGTGAQNGKNLGVPGYSHDIVMQLYVPILEQWGQVVHVANPAEELEAAITSADSQGLAPLHLSVIPCQDAYLSARVPNVLMPAWEFPDIPDHDFGDNPQNNWVDVANRCDGLMVSGPFTEQAFRKSGTTAPIHFVQVPTASSYFQLTDWDGEKKTVIECPAYSFPEAKSETKKLAPIKLKRPPGGLKRVGKQIETVVRHTAKNALGGDAYNRVSQRFRNLGGDVMPKPNLDRVELSGIVYTSIFNPNDGRKNWQDLITSFLAAVGDRTDVTLVLKLITRDPAAVTRFLRWYASRDISHQCKMVVIAEYLTEEQLVDLASASTYYIQTTRAEGNCLPLMNYLSAGRPGVTPCHSAISDYMTPTMGFIAESHPEPAAWPHDPQYRTRSSWGRLVWTSMVDQIRRSYQTVSEQPEAYQQFSQSARQAMRDWCSTEVVEQRMLSSLDAVWAASQHRNADAPDICRVA